MPWILLPGLDATGELFAPFLPHAPSALPVVYPRERFLDYEALTSFVRARLPEAEEGRYLLVGESFSGPVAIRLAAERPPGLCGLVLVSSFVRSPIGRYGPLNPLVERAGALRPPGFGIRFVLTGASAPDWLVEATARSIGSVALDVVRGRVGELLRVDLRATLASLELPLLCLVGTRDRLVRPGSLREILRARPDAKVARFAGAPHMLLQTRPAECAGAIREFARGVTAKR